MTDAEKIALEDALRDARLTAQLAIAEAEEIATAMEKLGRRKAEVLSRMEAAFNRLRALLPKASLPIPDEVQRSTTPD